MPPTAHEVLGRDLRAIYRVTDGRHEDIDLATADRVLKAAALTDLTGTSGVDNAVQAVIHRIKTVQGELGELGHPGYGSRHHELIGQPNTENNRNLVKLYILQALAQEPRIEEVLEAKIVYDPRVARDRVQIDLTLSFIDGQRPTNFVVPFSFEGG